MKKFAIGAAAAAIAVTGVAMTAPAADAATATRVRSYTAAQVAQHATAANCWTIIGSSVYNLTSFVNRHPGGSSRIIAICGTNGTAAFTAQHGSGGGPSSMLAQFKIGRYKK